MLECQLISYIMRKNGPILSMLALVSLVVGSLIGWQAIIIWVDFDSF